nr:fumarylacetoacetate hydrolase family protein [uncultured Devosia sp.]
MTRSFSTPDLAARLLLDARRTGNRIENLPEPCRPETHADAHRIQDVIVAELGGVGGWKIFAGDDPAPMLSPIPSSLIYAQDYSAPQGPLPISLVELEIAVSIGHDLPFRDAPYTADEALAAIQSLHPLIELITLSWLDRDKVDRVSQLADLQNSAGFVLGPALTEWRDFDTSAAGSTLIFDGVALGSAPTGADLKTIARTLAYLANHAAQRGLPLQRGHIVTTGARLVLPTGQAAVIQGDVAGLGSARLQLNTAHFAASPA